MKVMERGPLYISGERAFGIPVLRVCRRRRAGNSDDSTQLTMKYRDKPSGLRTIRSKHAVEGDRGRVKHYSLFVESGGSGWARGDFVLCGKRWWQGKNEMYKVVKVIEVKSKGK